MAAADLAFATEGARVTLRSAPGVSLVPGPGRFGRLGASGSMLFEAGAGIYGLDLFAAFWRDETAAMDWLRDFLCDPEMDLLIEQLANPPEEEEEAELLYSRSQLATLGSEVMDEY